VRAIFDEHYSRRDYRGRRTSRQFVGPGEKMVFTLADASAICVWRKFLDKCIDQRTGLSQQGVNCAVFRREGGDLASELLKSAMAMAWERWPGQRLYTYVDPLGVPPTMRASRPTWGHCFYQAGWRFAGLTRKRQHVLECIHESA
jgi:hypothetical protein